MSGFIFKAITIGRPTPLDTPEARAAQRELDKITLDPTHVYWTGDPAAVEHMHQLHRLVYGDRGVVTI